MKQVVKKASSILGILLLCVTLLAGCGNKKTVLFSFGDDKIYMDEAWIYFYMSKYSYDAAYQGMMDWKTEIPDGKGGSSTFEEMVKQQTLSTIKYSKFLAAKAEEEKLVLTDEELKQAKTGAKTIFDSWTGEEKTKYKITEADIEAVFAKQMLAQKYQEEACAKIKVDLKEEDYRTYNTYNLMFPTFKADKDNNRVEMTKAEKAKQLEKAEKALAKIKSGTEIRQIKTGEESGQIIFTKNDQDIDQTYKEEALKLKTGKKSGIVKTEAGYHIIEMFSDNDQDKSKEKKASLEKEKQLEQFYAEMDKLIKEKEGDWDFEKDVDQDAWASISFVNQSTEATTAVEGTTATEAATVPETTTAADPEATTAK